MSSKNKIILAALIILAAAVRLAAVLKYGDFWGDEMFSFVYSQKSWLDSIKFWLWETNPPLHMLVLKIWFYIFPATEFWARIPSLLFGTAAVFWIHRFTAKIFDIKTANIAALFLAISPYHVFVSATARGYSMLIFLSILSIYYFFLIFIEGYNISKRNMLSLALVNLLLLFTHLTAVAIITGQLIILIYFRHWQPIKKWVKINVIPLIAGFAWIANSLSYKMNLNTLNYAWFWQAREGIMALFEPIKLLIAGPFWLPTIALLIIISVILFVDRKKIFSKKFWIIVAFAALPISGASMLCLWNIKFFIIALPFVIILFALICVHRRISWIIAGLIMLFGLAGIFQALPINNWISLDRYLDSIYNPAKKQIFIYNNFATKLEIDRYISTPIAKLPYYPTDDWQNWDYALITQNYLRYVHPETEIKMWANKNISSIFDEIIVYQEDNFGVDLIKILSESGWHGQKTEKFDILSRPTVVKFTKI